MRKVTYLYQSGFLVELDQIVLLFDYYRGELPEFGLDKPLYVFASHRHYDHFTPEIFRLFSGYPSVSYVLSRDIRLSDRYLERRGISPSVKEHVTFLPPNTTACVEGVSVETFSSTDEGVAFAVDTGETSVYHAGDLNLWLWREEGERYNQSMRADYQKEMDKLAGRRFDLAFVPLDPRQEDGFGFGEGLQLFLQTASAEVVFPMHFGADFSYLRRCEVFRKNNPAQWRRVMEITREGQAFLL